MRVAWGCHDEMHTIYSICTPYVQRRLKNCSKLNSGIENYVTYLHMYLLYTEYLIISISPLSSQPPVPPVLPTTT